MARQVAVGKGHDKAHERALRRYAMEPIKLALAANEPPMSHTWLRRKLAQHGLTLSKTLLSSYLNGWARVTREFVKLACVIAGANPGDVYARIAGHEAVLFQPEKE